MELTFRRFYVLVQPDKDTVDMPWYFFDRFKDELQRRVWLIDSRGSMFGVFIQKNSDGAYFYKLVTRLIEHYDQPLGLILRLKYIGDSIFQMSVRNLDMVKIQSTSFVQTYDHPDYVTAAEMRDMYDAPVQQSNDGVDVGARATEPTVVEVKGTSSDCNGLQDDCLAAGSFDMDDKSDDGVENVDNFVDVVAVDNLVSSIVLISLYQISSNKLYLPTKLVTDALIREKPTSVTLVDSDNDEFQCKLRWRHRGNQVKAYLSGGWMEFCRDNLLSAGTRVRLAVNPTNPKVIYARGMYEAPVQQSIVGVDVGAHATEVKGTSSDSNVVQDDCLSAGSFDMDKSNDGVENVENFDDVVVVDNLVSSVIPISPYQASSNDLYLPIKFVRDGLIREKPTSVTLVDSVNDEYQCKIRWKHRGKRVKAYLSGGWMEFCRDNQFRAGTKVRLAVNPTNPKVIYAREALLRED